MYQQQSLANASLDSSQHSSAMLDSKNFMFLSSLSNNFANFANSSSGGHFTAPISVASSSSGSSGSLLPLGGPMPAKRERTKYTEYQLRYLESVFQGCRYPDGARREEIAQLLQLTDVKVQVWFKNRRAKNRNEEKFTQMTRQAAKVNANRKSGGAIKREPSVEDTEEEDQQQLGSRCAKPLAETGKKGRANGVKNSKSSTVASPLLMAVAEGQQQQCPSLVASSSSSYQLPKVESSGDFISHWPAAGQFTAGSGSLMQMAAGAFHPSMPGHHLYGWPQSVYSSMLPPTYSNSSQMFSQLANYSNYPNSMAYSNYFPTSAIVPQQQPD